MKALLPSLIATAVGTLLVACSHLDLTPPAAADRVVMGTVTNHTTSPLPAGTEITVRVLDVSRGEGRPEVLAEQTIPQPAVMPVPFRVEFTADDALLRRGVRLEARISVRGQLRYTTLTAYPLTPANWQDAHLLEVVPMQKH